MIETVRSFSAQLPVSFKTVDLVFGVTVIANEASRFQCVDELLGFKVRAAQQLTHGVSKLSLAFDVSRWLQACKALGEA